MATFANLDSFKSAYSSSYSFASQNLTEDDVIYVTTRDKQTTLSSVTSPNLTWTAVYSDSGNGFYVYRAVVGSTLTGEVVTLTFSGGTAKMAAAMIAVTGADLTDLDNNSSSGATSSGNSTPESISAGTLASMGAGSGTIVFAAAENMYGTHIGADTGYVATSRASNDDSTVAIFTNVNADTSPTYVIPQDYKNCFHYAIEVPEASGGGGGFQSAWAKNTNNLIGAM